MQLANSDKMINFWIKKHNCTLKGMSTHISAKELDYRTVSPFFTYSYMRSIELTRCPSWHELPKSTILMADLLGLQSNMFSGFRSQCIMFSSGVLRNNSAVQSCCANLRVRFSETPRKFVFLSRSYRLYESSSNTRHRWLRHIKWRLSLTKQKTGKREKDRNN